jgi:hypothetical protein
MNAALEIGIAGVGVWSPQWPNWDIAQAALCANAEMTAPPPPRPAPTVLPPTERRRAPEAVLIAVEAAQQACAMAQCAPHELAHVFASAYGDLAVNDYLCAVLAHAPRDVSPTRFHNSVHNAPAGYWAIATGCMRSSTAVSAGDGTFGAALLETALVARHEAVLLVVYDVAATGPLQDVVACRSSFAAAFVLAPTAAPALARLRLRTGECAMLAPDAPLLHANHQHNPAARSMPLLAALARRETATLCADAGPQLKLAMEILF